MDEWAEPSERDGAASGVVPRWRFGCAAVKNTAHPSREDAMEFENPHKGVERRAGKEAGMHNRRMHVQSLGTVMPR
jgi:hypothetical protein